MSNTYLGYSPHGRSSIRAFLRPPPDRDRAPPRFASPPHCSELSPHEDLSILMRVVITPFSTSSGSAHRLL